MAWTVEGRIEVLKNPFRGNEDGEVIDPKVIAIIDGVSAGVNPAEGIVSATTQLTAGQFAMHNAQAALRDAVSSCSAPTEVVPFLTQRLMEGLDREPVNGVAAYTFVAFFPGWNTIIRVGDCPFAIDGVVNHSELAVDRKKARVRQILLRLLRKLGVPESELILNDPTGPLMDYMTRHWQAQHTNHQGNKKYGYGVMNGFSVPDSLVEYFTVPRDAQKIVLTTDGMPSHLIKKTAEGSLEALRELLRRDPLCYKEWVAVRGLKPGQEVPDDCTGLWLRKI